MANPGATVTSKGPGLGPVLERLADLSKLRATVGYQGASGAAKAGDSDLSTATLAAIHEYGTENVESRPFMRRGAEQAQGKVQRLAAEVVVDVVAGKAHADTAGMERIGESVLDAVRHELDTVGSWGGGPDLVDDDQSLRRGLTVAVRKGDTIIGSEHG